MRPIGTHNYFVYILTNKHRSVLYIGVTNDLEVRLYQHSNPDEIDIKSFTAKYQVKYLIYWERHEYINDAIDREKQLKKWSRKKKEGLIQEFNPKWRFLNEDISED